MGGHTFKRKAPFVILKRGGGCIFGDYGTGVSPSTVALIVPMVLFFREICELAEKYNALVFLDECHATGFLGKMGR